MIRTILHVDMDAFYTSVEQRDFPAYQGKPVVVGADPKEGLGRGVVAACSYEARKFGIHSAMPISRAYRLCPRAVFLRPDFRKYSEISRRIRSVFLSFTPLVEPLSIDEAFLDISEQVTHPQKAAEIARQLKQAIRRQEELTASVGIGSNKLIAKIASDLSKPDGLLMVEQGSEQAFLDPLPISRLWGVGPKTEARLKEMGFNTVEQLRHCDRLVLSKKLGKAGDQLWLLSRASDDRPVITERQPKSMGQEKTFPTDVQDDRVLEDTLQEMSVDISAELGKWGLSGKTVTLKLRYSDFTTITRQITLVHSIREPDEILALARELLKRHRNPRRRIRLIGISVSSFRIPPGESGKQLSLFP
jgi:DNA polymerase IV